MKKGAVPSPKGGPLLVPTPCSQEPGSDGCPITYAGSRDRAKHLTGFAGSHQVWQSWPARGAAGVPPAPGLETPVPRRDPPPSARRAVTHAWETT